MADHQEKNFTAEAFQNWLTRLFYRLRGKSILGLREAHAIRCRAAGKFAEGEKPSQFAILAIAADVLNVPVRIQEEGSLAIRVADYHTALVEEDHRVLEKNNRKEINRLELGIRDSERETAATVSALGRGKESAQADMDFFDLN